MHAERITPPPGKVFDWGERKWKLAPEEMGGWFRWDPAPGGAFEHLSDEQVPDAFWVFLAKSALTGRDC